MGPNNVMTGYRISAYLSNGQYYETLLPVDSQGIYYLENPSSRKVSDVMPHAWLNADNGKLRISIDKSLRFHDPKYSAVSTRELQTREAFNLVGERLKILVYVSPESGRTSNYEKYYFNSPTTIIIGRDPNCDICYSSKLVSSVHASVSWDGKTIRMEDNKSSNGTYLNGVLTEQAVLKMGDKIHIGGMDIIIGEAFIAINRSGSMGAKIRVNSTKINKLHHSMIQKGKPTRVKSEEFFSRYPRRRLGMPKKEILVDSPPYSMMGNQLPLLLRMGSSLVMGGTSAMMGNYTMLLSTVLFPFLTSKYSEKEKKDYEQMRVARYTEYLKSKSEEILQEIFKEEKILNTNYPSIKYVLRYPEERDKLWSRKITDDDFLNIRVGSGEQKLIADVQYSRKDFSVAQDKLEQDMYTLVDRDIMIENIPIMINFKDNTVSSIIGNSKMTSRFMENMIWRMAMLYSYDEVKMMFVIDEDHMGEMEYIRYLPHVWTDDYSVRFIATNSSEAYQISDYLSKEAEMRKERSKNHTEVPPKHFVIFAQNKKLFDEIEALKDLVKEKNPFVSILTFFPDVPREAKVLIRLHTNKRNKITYLEELERLPEYFDSEYAERSKALVQVNKLSGIRLKTVEESNSLPSSVGFLELFKVKTIKDLQIQKRWSESNPIKSLAAPIGLATDGSLFELDLHQKFQGPHGLVAGTTGSGKSEFLITYILSLAVNYHPDEAAFVLIDYKGGGLAGAFSNPDKGIYLPHVIGTITNLDGSTIQRAITSIEAELERRQRVFNEAKNLSEEGTMDIYLYQQLYRAKTVKEPMPHLFIISDEFAELKQKEPAFLEKLVSAARIGRSLGVHLILATQKPSGVVTYQFLSNPKLSLCLKLQSRSDSKDMLKRPDAADLKDPGRFYLQVGYNEFFALGQSAWCGAPYNPNGAAIDDKQNYIKFVDNTGTVIKTARKQRTGEKQNFPSQLVSIVSEISNIAERERIQPRQLWEPPLPSVINLDDMKAVNKPQTHSRTEVWLGIADDPKRQRQFPVWQDMMKANNVWIVGLGRTGKTSLVQSLLLQIAEKNTPEQAHFYILDFSGNGLRRFSTLPHCGQIVSESEIDQLPKFFDLIDQLIDERKKEFEKLEVSDFESACLVKQFPVLYVVIDGVAVMKSTNKGEKIFFEFADYLKSASKLGIQYILTSGNISDLSMKIKNEINTRIAYSLKERYEYEDALGPRIQTVIPDYPGRGLKVIDGEVLEIQTPYFAPGKIGQERNQAFQARLDHLKEKYKEYQPARGFPKIPVGESYLEFEGKFGPYRLPLGYGVETAKPIALPFLQFSSLGIYFGGNKARDRITESMLLRLAKEKADIYIYKAEKSVVTEDLVSRLLLEKASSVHVFDGTLEGLTALWNSLQEVLMQRLLVHKEYCERMGYERFNKETDKSGRYMIENTNPLFIWAEGFYELVSQADAGAVNAFQLIYERGPFWNTYIVASLFPETAMNMAKHQLFQLFNPENLTLLIGGEFMKQKFVTVTKPYSNLKKDEVPNFAVLNYRGKPQYLMLPCGVFEEEVPDPDELSIF